MIACLRVVTTLEMLKILPTSEMLIYRKEEGIFLPSSGLYVVAMAFLGGPGCLSWQSMLYRNEEGPLLNIIFRPILYRREEGL